MAKIFLPSHEMARWKKREKNTRIGRTAVPSDSFGIWGDPESEGTLVCRWKSLAIFDGRRGSFFLVLFPRLLALFSRREKRARSRGKYRRVKNKRDLRSRAGSSPIPSFPPILILFPMCVFFSRCFLRFLEKRSYFYSLGTPIKDRCP